MVILVALLMVQGLPWQALQYLVGETNYGGRVTDSHDRRLLTTLVQDILSQPAAHADAALDAAGLVVMPQAWEPLEAASMPAALGKLPAAMTPAVFGLHENSADAQAANEARLLLGSAYALLPAAIKAVGTAASAAGAAADSKHGDESESKLQDQDEAAATPAPSSGGSAVATLAASLLQRVPEPFDTEAMARAWPPTYDASMNTLLLQEAARYNRLTAVVASSLRALQSALAGEQALTAEVEAVGLALEQGAVPAAWSAVAYPSDKPVASWMADWAARLEFVRTWSVQGPPASWWLPGLFFPQGFLTSVRQQAARKLQAPIDQLEFKFQVRNQVRPDESTRIPEDGVLAWGLFIEGGAWHADPVAQDDVNSCAGYLGDPPRRPPIVPFPILHILPVVQSGRAGSSCSDESLVELVEDSGVDALLEEVKEEEEEETKVAVADSGSEDDLFDGDDDVLSVVSDLFSSPSGPVYDCPLYRTPTRAGTLSTTGHSTNFVFTVQLRLAGDDSAARWIRAGTALLASTAE